MSKDKHTLRQILNRIDGRGYPAYKDIRGSYDFGEFTLYIDHVQGDPFAAPSRLRARVPMAMANFPVSTRNNRSRLIALRDFLCRIFAHTCQKFSDRGRGSGERVPRHGVDVGAAAPGVPDQTRRHGGEQHDRRQPVPS